MFEPVKLAISVGVSPRQPLAGWAAQAAELEAAGVHRVWLIDSQLAMKDVYAGLYLAASATSRLELGTGVTNPLTRHPTVTANAIAALSELSGGRALLGVGAGDSAVYGLGRRPARVAQVEDAVRFFREVLNGRPGALDGRDYELPHLAAPVPVWLAASQRRMCELAGRLCDGVILMGPADPGFVKLQVEWVESGLASAGRARADLEICLMATMSARDADPAAAVDDVRSWASTEARLIADFAEFPAGLDRFRAEILRARETYDFSRHLSTHADHQAAVSDELARALAIAGTSEECAARVRALLAAGLDGCIFPLLGGGRLERLQVIREAVLPLVQA